MRTIVFLCGLVTGVFALLILQSLGKVRIPRPHLPPPAGLAGAADRGARQDVGDVSSDEKAALDELAKRIIDAVGDPRGGRGLDPIAVALEEAHFERDWERVQVVADLIRKNGAAWTSAPSAASLPPKPEESLFEQATDVRRKLDEERLQTRRNRATALAGKADRVSIDELIRILETSDDEAERDDAAWLIAKSGDDAGIRELVHDLHADAAPVRAAAGFGLAREDILSGASEAASILATDPSVDLRRTAVACLGQYEAVQRGASDHPAVQPFLDALTKDQSESVRAEAARMLERCDIRGSRDLRSALYDAIDKDDGARVRLAAVQSLAGSAATFGLPDDAPDRIARAIRTEKSADVDVAMIDFLQRYGDEGAVPALDELAAQPVAQQNEARIAAARQAIAARIDAARR